MMREGDDETGFSIAVDAGEVLIRGWGFWSAELSQRFSLMVQRELGDSVQPRGLKVDVRELKPMRDEGQRAWSSMLGHLAQRGVTHAQLSEPSALTKLQFMRLCRAVGLGVQFV